MARRRCAPPPSALEISFLISISSASDNRAHLLVQLALLFTPFPVTTPRETICVCELLKIIRWEDRTRPHCTFDLDERFLHSNARSIVQSSIRCEHASIGAFDPG